MFYPEFDNSKYFCHKTIFPLHTGVQTLANERENAELMTCNADKEGVKRYHTCIKRR